MNKVIAQYMSVPYRSGGTGKLGLDCSGFVYVVYRDYDETRLPLTVRSQYHLDHRVDYNDLSYGDLIFFTVDKRKVSHVGIYLGEGKFVHASKSRGVVIDNLTDDYWIERYSGARRVAN
jgi:cell wall-associated NlpC family hydrolase